MRKPLVLLQLSVFGCSFAGVLSKTAAEQPLFSSRFFACYLLALGILAGYAVVWQQLLKRLPLTTAYACRSLSVVWAAGWGWLIFGETISWRTVCAAACVLAGMRMVVTADG